MFGKLNARKMLDRMAPMAQEQMQPQGGLGALLRGLGGSQMGYMPPPQTMPAPEPRMIASPGRGMGFGQAMGAGQGIGGILASLARMMPQNDATPSNFVSAPRQLTPEEAIAITSMPARPSYDIAVAPPSQGLGARVPMPAMMPVAQMTPQGPSPEEIARLQAEASMPGRVDNSTMISMPNFRFGETPQQLAPNAERMAYGGLMAKYGGGMC